jgi:hypothetical protein
VDAVATRPAMHSSSGNLDRIAAFRLRVSMAMSFQG